MAAEATPDGPGHFLTAVTSEELKTGRGCSLVIKRVGLGARTRVRIPAMERVKNFSPVISGFAEKYLRELLGFYLFLNTLRVNYRTLSNRTRQPGP